MKVLEINVYNSRNGGSQTVFFNTSELLEEAGHEVIRYTLKWDNNEPSKFSKYFPESKDTRKGLLRPIKNIITYFYHFEAARNLEKLIADTKPDIAQIHLMWGQLSPSILPVLKRHNIPVVFTNHDYRLVCPGYLFLDGKGKVCEDCKGKHFYKCISNTCCKGSKGLSAMMAAEQYFRNKFFHPAKYVDGILYVSNFSKNIHEKYMPQLKEKPSLTLYNFAAVNTVPRSANKEKYFLFFGRLSREKGISILIDTFAKTPEYKLKIVGKGPLENEIKEKLENLNCSNIELLGYKKGDELMSLIQNAFFAIVPSECYENNPMAIVESYSLGTPVIGARIGGIHEIIEEDKTGYTFQSGSSDELLKSIYRCTELSSEEYTEMCKNALQFAKTNFNKEIYIEKLLSFFEKLINLKKK